MIRTVSLRTALVLAGVLFAAAGLGCGGGSAVAAADAEHGVRLAREGDVVGFYSHASSFYSQLARRRFNTRATYRDPRLRDFFQDEDAFADYYAALARALAEANFERNRPLRLDVVEFAFEEPDQARVAVQLVGEDARPLRWGERTLEREDLWERRNGRWWLTPGKL